MECTCCGPESKAFYFLYANRPFGTRHVFSSVFLEKVVTVIARTERDAIKVKMAPPVVGDIAVKKPSEETIVVPEIEKLLERDPYLKPHEKEIRRRYVFIKFVNIMLIFIYSKVTN